MFRQRLLSSRPESAALLLQQTKDVACNDLILMYFDTLLPSLTFGSCKRLVKADRPDLAKELIQRFKDNYKSSEHSIDDYIQLLRFYLVEILARSLNDLQAADLILRKDSILSDQMKDVSFFVTLIVFCLIAANSLLKYCTPLLYVPSPQIL
jgi:hypothetical protein